MADPFQYPKLRLGRANQGLKSLFAQSNSFFDKQPWAKIVEREPETARHLHKLKLTRKMPVSWNARVVEIIEHGRAALDQAGFVTAKLNGVSDSKRSYFPVADTAEELETSVIGRGRCKDLPPDILMLFRSFKPYKGGNDAIWALNRLCGTSKHKLLSVGLDCPTFKSRGGGFIRNGHIPMARWDREKNEMIFGVVGEDGAFQYDFEFTFFISFGEIAELAGEPTLPLLAAALVEVATIIAATEDKARDIGIMPGKKS